MTVRIVTDSTADLYPEQVREHNVAVVPLTVKLDGKEYKDGQDLTPKEFFLKLTSSSGVATTSQPTPEAFARVYRELLADPECEGIVSIHISGKLSGTWNSAWQAAQEVAPDKIRVIDSQTVSVGLGMIVLPAARAALAGESLDQVAERVQGWLSRSRAWFVVDTLEYLQRGGRIGKATQLLGTMLDIKPVLQVSHGELAPVERVRTRRKALDRLFQLVQNAGPVEAMGMVYSQIPEYAQREAMELKQRVGALFPVDQILINEYGAVVGAHGGPGIVGIGVVLEE